MVNINGRKIGLNHPPYVIAEMSANHNGSLQRAMTLIEAAKSSGASAVKLQTYTADTMTIDCDLPDFKIQGGLWDGYKLYDLYKWAQTPMEWHSSLFEHAHKLGITIFSSPFDESCIDFLENLNAPAYKIASFEATDLPLVRYAASTGKPLIISTGMASEIEIEETVAAAKDAGCENPILLHCISSYPTPIEQANLKAIIELQRRYQTIIGLSDHTLGNTTAIAAVALGACVIEKHFCLSRNDKGPDSEFSLEPQELQKLASDTYDTWQSLGNGKIARQPAEELYLPFRRSIYFVKDLSIGHCITEGDIRRIRPGLGLAPKYFDQILGKRLRVDVKKGTATQWDLFDS